VELGPDELLLVDAKDRRFVYRIEPGSVGPTDLRIQATDSLAEGLGVAVLSVELAADLEAIGEPTARFLQPVDGELRPEQVWRRSGFFPDFNWTNGEARLEGLSWPVSDEHCELMLRLHGVHPESADPGALEIALWVNGMALELAAASPRELLFHLPAGLPTIETVTIRSGTFVPARTGGGRDTRTLGVPVEKLVLIAGD
jgi:hypothetical protein